MKSRLLLLLLVCLLSAETYTVSNETISRNRFFAITDLLEEVPVLEMHIFDVADVSISSGGRNSLEDASVLFCIDDLPINNFHDGRQLLSQRLLQNYDIDSIVVYTGPDVYRYSAKATTVIHIITKSVHDYPKKVFLKPYVGSEVGDPTLLKKILPQDSIPLNKDQVLAGEASAEFTKNDLLFKGGISVELMDPYTSAGEGQRSLFYPEQNSHQSLLERKDGHFRFGLKRGTVTSITSIAFGDYDYFRFSPFAQRYFYFEGINGAVRNKTSITKEKGSLNLSLFALYDQGHFYRTAYDSLEQKLYSGAGDISGRLSLKEYLTLDGHFALLADNKDHDQAALLPQRADSALSATAHIGLQMKRSRVQLTYPLGVHLSMQFNEQFDGAYSLVYPPGSKSALYETDLTWRHQKPSNTLALTYAMKITPTYSYVQNNGFYFREYRENNYAVIPQLTVQNTHVIFGKSYGSLTTYGGKVGISRDLPLRSIYFRGQLECTLPTYWSGFTPVSYADRSKSNAEKIDGYVVGNLSLVYTLPNRKVQLSAAIRNIGKKHKELPQGSLIGPIVVTNLEVAF